MSTTRRVVFGLLSVLGVVASHDLFERFKRQLLDADPAEVEVTVLVNLAVTIPLNDPTYSISSSVFMQGTYGLTPSNFTQPWQRLDESDRKARRATRASVYRAVEGLLERVGRLPGKVCLLRSICEAAAWPVDHDGLVGQLVHTILTPSCTSENGQLHSDYLAAEQLGRAGRPCSQYFASCPATPLDLMTTLASIHPLDFPDFT